MQLILLRHGQSTVNAQGLINEDPANNVPLTSYGREQVKIVAEKLKDKLIDVILVSEFMRTKQTAEIVNTFHDKEIIVDKRINERRFGKNMCEYLPVKFAVEKNPFGEWPGGENFFQFKDRIKSFVNWLATQDYDNVLVVTHAAVVKVIRAVAENIPDDKVDLPSVKEAEYFEVTI